MKGGRVLFVSLEFPPDRGGIGEYHRQLLLHSNWLDVLAPTAVATAEQSPRVLRGRFFWLLWPRWIPLLWTLRRALHNGQYQSIVVSHILPVGIVAFFQKKIFGTPYAVLLHGMDVAILRGYKKILARNIMREASLVVANSQATREDALAINVDEEKCFVLYPCPSLAVEQSIAHPRESSQTWRLLSIGRLVERKGFDTLIRVVAELERQGHPVRLTIVGGGKFEGELRRIISEEQLEQAVELVGSKSIEELGAFYANADLFVYLPRRLPNGDTEGFGMVCLDAALFGLPVVVSRGTGAEETIEQGLTGVLTDRLDVKSIASDISTLMNDPELRMRMGIAGRERILNSFRWSDRVKKLEALLVSDGDI